MQKFYHVFPRAISSFKCQEIINRGLSLPKQEASIGFDEDHTDNSYRVSTIRWMHHRDHKDVVDLLVSFAAEANREHFGFDIFNHTYDLQFTEYQGTRKGKYEWHHDVWWTNPRAHDRKLSVVIQLNDPNTYTGGDFEFRIAGCDMNELAGFRQQGSVLVFPSFFDHRVTPITQGTRYSLVSWIEGPKFR